MKSLSKFKPIFRLFLDAIVPDIPCLLIGSCFVAQSWPQVSRGLAFGVHSCQTAAMIRIPFRRECLVCHQLDLRIV